MNTTSDKLMGKEMGQEMEATSTAGIHKPSATSTTNDTYAVFQSGGRQHIARLGAKLKLDRMVAEVGAKMIFDKVLLLSDKGKVQIGSPYVAGQQVEVKVINHTRGDKIRVIKFKRRKNYLKRGTARAHYTEVEINAIGTYKLTTAKSAIPAKKTVNKVDATDKVTSKPVASKARAQPEASKPVASNARAQPEASKAVAVAKKVVKSAAKNEAKATTEDKAKSTTEKDASKN